MRAGQPAGSPGSGVAEVRAGWCAQARAQGRGRAPVAGAGVAVLRAVWRAQARAPGGGRVRARWPAGPHPCPARESRTGGHG